MTTLILVILVLLELIQWLLLKWYCGVFSVISSKLQQHYAELSQGTSPCLDPSSVSMNITEAKACKHHDWLFQLLLENVAKTQYTDFCIICMNFELIIPYTYLQLLSGADEVSGEWWQLITAIHDEGDGLMLCDLHTQGYDCTCSHFCFGHNSCIQSIIVEFSLQSHRYGPKNGCTASRMLCADFSIMEPLAECGGCKYCSHLGYSFPNMI